jgi:glutaredoxin-like protein NrdH
VKAWLSRAGVPFVIRDVDEDLDAYEELVALGFRSVPVTVIGEARIKGFNPAALETAVKSADGG